LEKIEMLSELMKEGGYKDMKRKIEGPERQRTEGRER
jgi:hypothetical protein